MPKITIGFGLACIALGLFAYFGSTSDNPSKTALIPAFFGLPMIILGAVAMQEKLRKHAMHVAVLLAFLAMWMPAMRGIPKTLQLLGGTEIENPRGAVVQTVFALLCVGFVVLCVQSFIAARKAMKQAEA